MARHPDYDPLAASAAARPRSAAAPPSGASLPRVLATLVLIGYGAGFCLECPDASAQGRKPAATLIVSTEIPLTPGAESPLDIRLAPGDVLPPKAVLIIRGVPPGVTLSEGRAFGTGVWVLPAALVTNLKLRAPADSKGGLLTIALATPDGIALAEAQISLVPAQQKSGAATAKGASRTIDRTDTTASSAPLDQLPAAAPVPRLTAENRAELMLIYEKGNESVKLGNILIARQFYLRAAEKGLSEAAFALATTYDPNELAKIKGAAGITADAALAKKWYERAMELGFPEAADHISELARR
jgi:hypothetical protein